MPRMCQRTWEACLECHSLGLLVECQSSNQLCFYFRLLKNRVPQWHPCLDMPGGHGKATWNVRGHAWNGGAATNYGSIFSWPSGKHAWNARGMRNISAVLVHGWVPKACWWETYLPRCSMIIASLTKSKYTKANLFQKSCMTLLSSAIPPFQGDGQMTKKCRPIRKQCGQIYF